MNPAITILDPAAGYVMNIECQIETLANDCQFTEGPVWNEDGFYLFSDTPANVIYKMTQKGNKEIYLTNSGTHNINDPDLKPDQIGSNALAYDASGYLLICQHGSHDIARYDGSVLTPIITSYNNKPFNSPNDLIIHNDRKIFFSDPPYGLKDTKLNPEKFQPLAGV